MNPRFVETAAASALRGRRAAEIEDELLRLGAAPKAAKVLAVRMAKKAKQARSPFPVLLAVGGAISVVVAIAVLVFFGDTLKSRSIFKLLGGAVTGAAALTAGVKSMRIAEKHRTLDRLIAAWAEDRDGRLDA